MRRRCCQWLRWSGLIILALSTVASAQLPGVAVVQTGTRATYYSSAASVRGSYQQAVLKPNCNPAVEDCWVDPDTGRTIGQEDVPTASGQGYTHVDILYLDAQTCVMRVTSYALDPNDGRITTAASTGDVTPGGTCSDYWSSPARLAGLEQQLTPTFRILKGPYTLGTITVDAVTIASSDAGAIHNNSYDAVTGLLVAASGRVQGSAVPTISPDDTIVAGAGSSQLSYTRFLDARQMPALGALGALPEHVLAANRLVYQCSYGTAMPGIGGIETPCLFETHLVRKTDLWVLTSSVLQMPDQLTGTYSVSESSNVIVAAGHGSYFADTRLLAGLESGMTLDVDPVTGVRTTVVHADDSVVAILEQSNAERKTFVYDRASGWLVQFLTEQVLMMSTLTQRIDLIRVE
jgi:hypothetical protein